MPATHVYEHPDEKGLGQHHSDGDLSERPAQPPESAAALRQAMSMFHPTPDQEAELETFLSRSMADLDMPHGTEVTLLGRDEDRNLERVSWTDGFGGDRVTSVTPEIFASHFREA